MGLFDKMKDKAAEQYDKMKSSEIGGKNIGDLVNPLENVINKTMDNHNESKKEQKITVATKAFGQSKDVIIRRDTNNYFYVSSKYSETSLRFTFERFDWGGSTFTQETVTKGDIKTKSRAGSALVGGLVAGPIGAVAGASGKRKSKVDTKSTTTTTETGSKATIYLRSKADGSIKEIKTTLTTAQANNLERFFANADYKEVDPSENISADKSPVEQVKELKELLDMEIITQEEFEVKKKELLGL